MRKNAAVVIRAPDRKQSLIAVAAFVGCSLLSAGFTLAAKVGDQSAPPPPSAQLLQIVLDVPPEPVIAPRPPMDVLPAEASREFDLGAYRQQVSMLRAQAAAEARRYAAPYESSWDQAWNAPLDSGSPLEPVEQPF